MRRRPIAYSADEMAWLGANRMMVISDYHRAFAEEFDRADVTAAHLHSLRKRKGWKVGRDPSRYVGRHVKFSPEEIAWLRHYCTMEINLWCEAFCTAFARVDMTPAKLHSMRKRMGWKTGRSGQFEKGTVSPNKGKRCPDGTGGRHPNARATQFKSGQMPHNARGPGHVSMGDDGYFWIVTDRRNPWTGASTWRVHLHRWLWEQAHGPVPDGQVLKCLDGNKANTATTNWEPVPRGLLPRLNGKAGRDYDHAPAELKPVIMTVAKLEHAIRNRPSKRRNERTPT